MLSVPPSLSELVSSASAGAAEITATNADVHASACALRLFKFVMDNAPGDLPPSILTRDPVSSCTGEQACGTAWCEGRPLLFFRCRIGPYSAPTDALSLRLVRALCAGIVPGETA